jgi:uncharacterized protein (DUF1778 family)
MPNPKGGRTHSVYFKAAKDLRRAKLAAKLKGVKLGEFMRDAVLAAAEKVIAKSQPKVEKLSDG